MPKSRPKTSAAEELHRLREETKKKDAKIAKLERDLAAAAKKKDRPLIPRPKGQAGRASGYNVQDEMGLGENGERYHRIYRITKDFVHQYLNVSQTISEQNKTRLESTITLLGQTVTFFQRFEGLWPAHDIIAGYLLNAQTRRRKDLELETAAEKGNSKIVGAKGPGEVDKACESETNKPARKRRRISFRVPDTDDESSEEEENPKAKTKRKASEEPTDAPPAKKPKVVKPGKQNHSARSLVWSDLPETCPTVECDDELPDEPNRRLLSLFQQREALIQDVGSSGPGVAFAELQICAAITQEQRGEKFRALGEQNEWPEKIDYQAVRDRVLTMREPLLRLIKKPVLLGQSTVWKQSTTKSSPSARRNLSSSLRTPYMGGDVAREFIINSTVLRLLSSGEDDHGQELHDTVSSLIEDDPDQFDDYDGSSI
ncbi:hypothetical protein DFH06DRAFT_1346643 [Mycena polygramma]|nr:hypothetical protein DFH06DRAFT_1346643 [Mycena polygramma]